MARHEARGFALPALALVVALATAAEGGINEIARCQRKIAGEGARYALRVIRSNLKCTNEITECQIQCELGVFGPPCGEPPEPGCCDVDDPSSNATYQACMDAADAVCAAEAEKREKFEEKKRAAIISTCSLVTNEELCGAETPGLNFETLNAGCLALDPGYVCNVPNLAGCVGGPLEHALLDEVTAVLSPRATEAVAALNLQAQFPDLPIARKVGGQLAPGKVDVWALNGQAGDEIIVKVKTRPDNPDGTTNLDPTLALLGASLGDPDPIPDTNVRNVSCPAESTCGGSCRLLRRVLPFNGIVHLAVRASPLNGCGGGRYRLVVVSPDGAIPLLVADDADLPIP
jgi:hypothetical protein